MSRLVRGVGEADLTPEKMPSRDKTMPPAPTWFPYSHCHFIVSSGQSYLAIVLSVSGAFLSLTYRARGALLSGTCKPSSGHLQVGNVRLAAAVVRFGRMCHTGALIVFE